MSDSVGWSMENIIYEEKNACDIRSFDGLKHTVLSTLGKNERSKIIILVCEEIFSNIINYSKADEVSFALKQTDDGLSVFFTDNGLPFDPVNAKLHEKEFEELDSGGMGLMLARMNTKEMVYKREGDKNILVLRFDIDE